MGLDMYLEAREYVSKWDYSEGEREKTNKYSHIASLAPEGFDKYSDFGGIQVTYPIGYWRKANAIHGWFVDNVQNGVDDCGSYHVSREDLIKLRDACVKVVQAHSFVTVGESANVEDVAEEVGLLPRSGFFFGSYEIDEWYIDDLNLTCNIINNALTLYPQGEGDWNISFHYSSSW
jgi:hypothetical protein